MLAAALVLLVHPALRVQVDRLVSLAQVVFKVQVVQQESLVPVAFKVLQVARDQPARWVLLAQLAAPGL